MLGSRERISRAEFGGHRLLFARARAAVLRLQANRPPRLPSLRHGGQLGSSVRARSNSVLANPGPPPHSRIHVDSQDRFLRTLQGNRILQGARKWPLTGPALVRLWPYRYPTLKGGFSMAATVTPSLVQQFASMKPADFGRTIEPKWQVAQRLVKEIQGAVEKEHLTPLDGARMISAVAATLFGYDEFILREISPETLLAAALSRRSSSFRAAARRR